MFILPLYVRLTSCDNSMCLSSVMGTLISFHVTFPSECLLSRLKICRWRSLSLRSSIHKSSIWLVFTLITCPLCHPSDAFNTRLQLTPVIYRLIHACFRSKVDNIVIRDTKVLWSSYLSVCSDNFVRLRHHSRFACCRTQCYHEVSTKRPADHRCLVFG